MIMATVKYSSSGIYHRVVLYDPLGQVWSSSPNFRHTIEFLSLRDARTFTSNAYAAIGRAKKNITTAAIAA